MKDSQTPHKKSIKYKSRLKEAETMKNIITLTMTLVITFGLSGCMMKRMMSNFNSQMGMMSGGSHVGMDMNDGNTSESSKGQITTNSSSDDSDKSYIFAKRYCTQCHVLHTPDEFSKDEWKPIVRRMLGYIKNQARLKPDAYESAMIEHYYGVQ